MGYPPGLEIGTHIRVLTDLKVRGKVAVMLGTEGKVVKTKSAQLRRIPQHVKITFDRREDGKDGSINVSVLDIEVAPRIQRRNSQLEVLRKNTPQPNPSQPTP